MFRKVGQRILGVEETHHGDSSGHVHGIHVADVNEGIYRGRSDWRGLPGSVLDDGAGEGAALTGIGRGRGRVQFDAAKRD